MNRRDFFKMVGLGAAVAALPTAARASGETDEQRLHRLLASGTVVRGQHFELPNGFFFSGYPFVDIEHCTFTCGGDMLWSKKQRNVSIRNTRLSARSKSTLFAWV